MSCIPCTTAKEEGWWGDPKITHCRDCHFTWPMTRAYQHCTVCHETFGGDEAATRHQGRNGCLRPWNILHKTTGLPILKVNAEGVWVRSYG